jgi:ubiquinone/menaquinone biosynthesis C-methylase UbiE
MNKEAISLVCCIPVFNERLGTGLFRFYNNSIPLPPDELIQAVGGGFQRVAFEFLDYFIRLANLKPTERILDVGCGIGRMAYALAGYLSLLGRYQGFDVVDKLIEWPRRNISNTYPNFRFRKVDLYNKWYNPTGKLRPDSFRFPYENNAFDFVLLCSVFTHMLPRSVTHYLEEIYRVLATNGRCLCTAFLINSESQRLIQEGKSTLQLVHPYQNHFVKNADVPEETIGYKEPILLDIIDKCNVKIERVEYGSWCGRAHYLSFQDIIIFKKYQ